MSARVLVVDDILPNVKLLEAKLSSEYYDVLTATNGMEALEKVASQSPDIVLLDVMMPGIDGFEVCRRIKADPATAHIPVVIVTALTDSSDRIKGLEAGADDFLSKPLNDTALMSRVRSLVRLKMTVDEWRVRENTATQLGVGDHNTNAMNEPVEQARVLVIEDQGYESKKFVEALKVDEDIVIIAETGVDAMAKVAQSEYDLLAVSLNLKNEDGLRLCSHLRSSEKTRSTPILMIANEEDMPRIAHGLEIGAHDYILRPVDRNELLARVRTQVRRKRFQQRLRSNFELSLSMALTDSLTGLYNRRYFDVHLQKLLEKNKASNKSMAVLMMDIDHFKSINDTHGHGVGDEILKIFAHRIQDSLRSFDLVARLGGEEFVVILPDVSNEMAYFIGERLRRAIADEPFACSAEGGKVKVTTSIGGIIIPGGTTMAMEEILKHADDALYDAKEGGRNATVFDEKGKLDPRLYQTEARAFIE
ncbi:MAG: PleD family two-component system response regulator [Micavibrio aeruginosavorus]|uniref:diguanylate cyclase n=1 Tax=Micavibrio aeruginosavorus TaxID=349221 RepID=A0A2W5PY66_9BACT|nr:MAG: PleD family two-component system response regulator [Micavibrio aeruginosavorus]